MKNDEVRQFLKDRRQRIDDGGFVRRLLRCLDYCPKPALVGSGLRERFADMLPLISAALGVGLACLLPESRALWTAGSGVALWGIDLVQMTLCAAAAGLLLMAGLFCFRPEGSAA